MNMPTEWDRSGGRRRVDGPGRPGTCDTLQAGGCKAHFVHDAGHLHERGAAPGTVEGEIFERFSPWDRPDPRAVRPNHIGTFAPPVHPPR